MSDNTESKQRIRMFTFSNNREEFEQQQKRVRIWLDALRGTEYPRNYSNKLKDEEGYNVFGVAVEVCNLTQEAEGVYRPEAFRELGLTTAIGHHYNADESCNGNLLDYKTGCRDFLQLASLIELHFTPAVWNQERWFSAMEAEKHTNLFDPELLKDDEVQNRITEWILALRSGNYKQGVGMLELEGLYCCLGVANTVCQLGESGEHAVNLVYTHNLMGLQTKNGDWGCTHSLTHANDSYGWTFEQIADFVEKERRLATNSLQD